MRHPAGNFNSLVSVNIRLILVVMTIICCPEVAVAADQKPELPALKLQSDLMSFADQFIAEIDQAANQYLYEGEAKSARRRMAVANGRLNACSAAVSIAASSNPEVALLDMMTMVKLYSYTVQDNWMPKLLGTEAKVFLDTFGSLEQKLAVIGERFLSKQQIVELNKLAGEWREANKDKLASVANVRFSEFSAVRHSDLLFSKGQPRGFLKSVSAATLEIERTRLLAERAIFVVERQPKLIAWQVEQVFYNLAVTDELTSAIGSLQQLPGAADRVAANIEKVSGDIDEIQATLDISSEANVQRIANRLSSLTGQVITKTINENFFRLFFYVVLLSITLLAVLLCYKYLSIKIEQRMLITMESQKSASGNLLNHSR